MTTLQEYKNSLKMAEVEEYLDLILYRPIAFVFVKLIYRLPITPNQVTLLSLLAGLVAAYCFSLGAGPAFVAAAVWLGLANILDCSDGMLARLQGSGTPLGRLVDGITDWVISVAMFLSLGVGLRASTGNPWIWALVVAGGVTSALHAMFFDYYQQKYISNVRGKDNFLSKEVDKTRAELEHLKGVKGMWWRKGGLRVYLWYSGLQERSQRASNEQKQYPPELYRTYNRRLMRFWTLLGSTTNRSLLILAGLLQDPSIFFWIVLIPGNLYLAAVVIAQRRARHRMEQAAD